MPRELTTDDQEELERTWARVEKAEARVAELEATLCALRKVAEEAKYVAAQIICRCDHCWTVRSMHSPDCVAYEVDGLRAALAAVPTESKTP